MLFPNKSTLYWSTRLNSFFKCLTSSLNCLTCFACKIPIHFISFEMTTFLLSYKKLYICYEKMNVTTIYCMKTYRMPQFITCCDRFSKSALKRLQTDDKSTACWVRQANIHKNIRATLLACMKGRAVRSVWGQLSFSCFYLQDGKRMVVAKVEYNSSP